MSPLFLALTSITTLFAALLAAKAATKRRFCVVCASVSLTWAGLLAAWRLGAFHQPALVALLMGQSVVGIYYLTEKRLPERYRVFRLPFLLTLTAVAAMPLGLADGIGVPVLLAALWAAHGALYAYRTRPRFRKGVAAIVACCGNW